MNNLVLDDLVLNNLIKENRDNTNISYMLEQERLFFETGYKVLQNQEKNGFIKCVKVLHNGKIKLVYDISKYKSLQSLLNQLTSENFLTIISETLHIISEVNHNGFMKCENIEVDVGKIFVDSNNLNVFLIYIPINASTNLSSIGVFERKLRKNLIETILKNKNLSSDLVDRLYNDLQNENYLLANIKENMKKKVLGDYSNGGNYESSGNSLRFEKQSGVTMPVDNISDGKNPIGATQLNPKSIEPKVDTRKKASIGSIMNGIFSSKKKKSAKVKPLTSSDFKTIYEGGATEVLDDIFTPNIALLGIGTPTSIEVVISKPEFIIGKNPESSDGVIQFNKAISRVHCKISCVNNSYIMEDLGSANGTYVNSVKLLKGQRIQIRIGDEITLANSEFIVKAAK